MFSIGDDFFIEDDQGRRAFKVDGKALRVRSTLKFEDANGRELETIQEKLARVRDVLIVNRGAALVRTEVYPIIDVQPVDGATAPKRQERDAIRRLAVDGHADVEVAVPPVVGAQLDRHSLPPTG